MHAKGPVPVVGCLPKLSPRDYQLSVISLDTIPFSQRNFLCSVFFIMSQATVTTTAPPVTVVCSSAPSFTMIATMVQTTLGLAAFGQHDVVLLPLLILRDTMRFSVGFATLPHWQQAQSQMPLWAYANYMPWSSLGKFLRVEPPN